MKRYTIQMEIYEVDDMGDTAALPEKVMLLDYATDDLQTLEFILDECYEHGNAIIFERGEETPTPRKPRRGRYNQGDGEDMLRRFEDAGGNRFATGLYGDVYDDDEYDALAAADELAIRAIVRPLVRYPDVVVELADSDGNAFAILGAVTKAMRRTGVKEMYVKEFMAEATSGDYDHLLQTCMRWVNVT